MSSSCKGGDDAVLLRLIPSENIRPTKHAYYVWYAFEVIIVIAEEL